jgi:hypothetical protein
MIGFALTLDIARLLAAAGHLEFRVARVARVVVHVLSLARALGLDIDIALDLTRALDRSFDVARAREVVRALAQALSHIIIKQKMIMTYRIAAFVEACKTLDRLPSHRGASPEASLPGFANALDGLATTLDVPRFSDKYSSIDEDVYLEFLTSIQRVLECREAAERVTQTGWDRVCERLFSLPKST